MSKRSWPAIALVLLLLGGTGPAALAASWHTASEKELRSLIPARAPVISERIETEFRTASGIIDGKDALVKVWWANFHNHSGLGRLRPIS